MEAHGGAVHYFVKRWQPRPFCIQPATMQPSRAMSAHVEVQSDSTPANWGTVWRRETTLRYGENPHQEAGLYVSSRGRGLARTQFLQGKALSYNNWMDMDAAPGSRQILALRAW